MLSGALKAFKPIQILEDILTLKMGQALFLIGMVVTMVSLSIYWDDTMVNLIAGVTGVICVFLVNMRRISSYAWGTVNALLYGYSALSVGLYGDTGLNWIFYLPMQVIGAYFWSQRMTIDRDVYADVVKAKSFTLNQACLFGGILLFSYLSMVCLLSAFDGSQPYKDAATTTLSIAATFLMVRGYREQWFCWFAVNVISIMMWYTAYLETGTGFGVLIMWVMFLINSIYGTITWSRASAEN